MCITLCVMHNTLLVIYKEELGLDYYREYESIIFSHIKGKIITREPFYEISNKIKN